MTKVTKKVKPTQAKKNSTTRSVVTRDNTPSSNFTGTNNHHHIHYVDYYGDVYAKYVGPIEGFTQYSIWVPKTLVANLKGPIEKWGPKSKQ